MNFDITLDNTLIEDVLLEKKSILPDNTKDFIKQRAQKHADKIIDITRQLGVEYKAFPVVFCGGGSLLLKDNLINNPLINVDSTLFLADPCANAKGYAALLKKQLRG